MKNNKLTKNFQKKKYYTNRNKFNQKKEPEMEYYYDPLKKEWGSRISK